MPTITKYCNTYSQTADSNNAKFANLVTLKSASGYAETSTISKKGGPHPKPSTVTATNFQFNLPNGAEVTKIKVEYAHRKVATTKDKYPALPAPTIDLVGASAAAKVGAAPSSTSKTHSVSWTGNWSRAVVNSSSFGVKIAYKSNTSIDYTGKLRLSLLRVTVTYKTPSYSLTASVNGDKTVDSEGTVTVTLNNLNKTSYNPRVVITLPTEVSYLGSGADIVQNSATTLTWNPHLKSNVGSAGCSFKVGFDTATGEWAVPITARENYSSKSRAVYFSIAPKVVAGDETDDSESISDGATIGTQAVKQLKSYWLTDETSIIYTFNIPQGNEQYVLRTLGAYDIFNSDEIQHLNDLGIEMRELNEGDWVIRIPQGQGDITPQFNLTMDFTNFDHGQEILIREWLGGQDYAEIGFLGSCETSLCLMKLTEEELNRMGDGYTYTVQTYAKASLTEEMSYYNFREGKHSFRMGVFNGDISGFQYKEWEMVQNCENWSNPIESLDEYYNLKVDFVYNSEYPVYVFITSQYLELNEEFHSLKFTKPVLIESDYFDQNGRVTQNALPYPIRNTVGSGETSSLTVNTFQRSNPLILYDFDLPTNFSTDENSAIRGIKLSAEIITDNEIIINAKLRIGDGVTGERSLVLMPLGDESETGEVTLGGSTDLWGFSVGDMQNIDQSEIELSFNNLFTNDNNQAQLQISNLTLSVYYIDLNEIRDTLPCLINDESIWWYGAYITKLSDVQGLKTDTEFIQVKGTDTNEPYLQTIKEKEIEIGFSIDGCTVTETTELVKSFAGQVTNERDEHNRPVLNKIEFPSLYPNEHWDFLLIDGIDNDVSNTAYEGTLKITIPAGTSYANEDTVTNTRGHNHGIANVNPIITVIPTSDTVEITETTHNQSWKIHYPFSENSLLEIDCNSRTATLKTASDENSEGTDVTAYVDYNSDWFTLYRGEFNFESISSIIQMIQYNERG